VSILQGPAIFAEYHRQEEIAGTLVAAPAATAGQQIPIVSPESDTSAAKSKASSACRPAAV
jgi:hypothetical protein